MLYPKIETIFERDEKTFKVITDQYKDPIYSIINKWEFTEKIDGTNIRILKGNCLEFGGRTEKATVPQPILNYFFEVLSMSKLEEVFGDKDVIIYGEGYGGKIQAGEEDKKRCGKYSDTEKFIVFDILVGGKFWLKRSDIEEICKNLGLDVVPLLRFDDIEEAWLQTKRGFLSDIGDCSYRGIRAEGMIGKTSIPLFDSKHRRLIFKIKTRDF